LTVLSAPAATAPATTTHIVIVTQAACAEGVRALVELHHKLQRAESGGQTTVKHGQQLCDAQRVHGEEGVWARRQKPVVQSGSQRGAAVHMDTN
jgi:hypothetical protein